MRRGTKIIVFIASMALTLGSLFAFVGPRHCGMHGHRGWHHEKMTGEWGGGCDKGSLGSQSGTDGEASQQ